MKKSHANWVKENCNYILDTRVSRSFLEGFHNYMLKLVENEKNMDKEIQEAVNKNFYDWL